jgi:cell division septum initiation protein DivIVA
MKKSAKQFPFENVNESFKMAEKNFRNWVGFREEADRAPVANPVDRIRELESQLADLKSRRDITGLSREEFEILATETAMSMIKSAQAREAKALGIAERVISESTRNAKDVLEGAETKARSLLAGAETRGRKYISVAELEAAELIRNASREASAIADAKVREADAIVDGKRREAAALAAAARREAERLISEASENVVEYRAWLADVISESERLYRSQTQAFSAAEAAIAQSRDKLDGAFARLNQMQKIVDNALNEDGTVKRSAPIRVESKRTRPALDAPGRSSKSPAKRTAKKSTSKRK